MTRDKLSIRLRDRILEIASKGREGHIGSSFSIVEILIAALFEQSEPIEARLERFVLSKGHASLALYAAMLELGVLTDADLDNFAERGSRFGGHPTRSQHPPVPVSTGSLGHGLPVCAGMAFASRLSDRNEQFICLCGDGELNEGSIWESLLLIRKFRLGNMTLIVDNNSSSTRAIDLGNIAEKLRSFGLYVTEVDGHDIGVLRETLADCARRSVPCGIVANTVKGHGSAITKGSFAWHHRVPSAKDVEDIRNGYYL